MRPAEPASTLLSETPLAPAVTSPVWVAMEQQRSANSAPQTTRPQQPQPAMLAQLETLPPREITLVPLVMVHAIHASELPPPASTARSTSNPQAQDRPAQPVLSDSSVLKETPLAPAVTSPVMVVTEYQLTALNVPSTTSPQE